MNGKAFSIPGGFKAISMEDIYEALP